MSIDIGKCSGCGTERLVMVREVGKVRCPKCGERYYWDAKAGDWKNEKTRCLKAS